MRVKCNRLISQGTLQDIKNSPWVTLDKEYVVFALVIEPRRGVHIFISTEHYHEPGFFSITGFEMISQNIPSSWITVVENINGDKVITMLPRSWNYETFFEEVEDGNLKAVELFNLEAKKMYREEGLV